jgi:hypothetical protein
MRRQYMPVVFHGRTLDRLTLQAESVPPASRGATAILARSSTGLSLPHAALINGRVPLVLRSKHLDPRANTGYRHAARVLSGPR